MGEIVVNTHNFDNAKREIQAFSNNLPAAPEFQKVKTSAGVFGWRSHKVTGEELNEIVADIQRTFVQSNNITRNIVKEFSEIYKAFESLDKDYIQGILISLKGAEHASIEAKDASLEARNAQKDITRTIDALSTTVKMLKEFKERVSNEINTLQQLVGSNGKSMSPELLSSINKLSNIHHLDAVDVLWNDAQTMKTFANNITIKTQNIGDNINILKQRINKISESLELDHLKDVDTLWRDIQSIKPTLSNLSAFSDKARNQIQELETLEYELNAFITVLKTYKHLSDIDNLWDLAQTQDTKFKSHMVDYNNFKKKTTDATDKATIEFINIWKEIRSHAENITKQANEHKALSSRLKEVDERFSVMVGELISFRRNLEKQIHLHQIDELWKHSHSVEDKTIQLKSISDNHEHRLVSQLTTINQIKVNLAQLESRFTTEQHLTKKRFIISYIIGGLALLMAATHLTLHILGVL